MLRQRALKLEIGRIIFWPKTFCLINWINIGYRLKLSVYFLYRPITADVCQISKLNSNLFISDVLSKQMLPTLRPVITCSQKVMMSGVTMPQQVCYTSTLGKLKNKLTLLMPHLHYRQHVPQIAVLPGGGTTSKDSANIPRFCVSIILQAIEPVVICTGRNASVLQILSEVRM